ncbi:MAG: amidohydrolase family protein [Chloroflexota bacterium]
MTMLRVGEEPTKLGATPIMAPGWTAEPREKVGLVDCDVHHNFRQPSDLLPYLSKFWQDHLLDQGLHLPGGGHPNTPMRSNRSDLKEPDLMARDFNYSLEFTQRELLDRWNVDYALLTGPPPFYGYSGLPDPDWAAALCTAFNDYTIDNWLDRDPRVVNAILISPSDPVQAVAEINRLAHRKDTVAVMVPMGTQWPFGNRFYHPIWEACVEHDLPVVSHIGGGGGAARNSGSPVGVPTYYMETRMARPQVASTHAASLICEGVFEKFPTFKVALTEVQQLWAVSLMWHMDVDWKSIGDQTPWLKRKPSEYFRDHIRVGTQPMHEPELPEQMHQMLEMLHADETLVFCSDFPHFDANDPVTVFPKLDEHVHQRIFADNAMEMLRIHPK